MTTQLAPPPVQRFYDNAGNLAVGGLLYTYQSGTTTPQATYTDNSGSTPNTNPIVLNARGECQIWLDPSLVYKLVLQDSSANVLWTVDNIQQQIGASAAMTPVVNAATLALARTAMGITPANIGAAPRATRIDVASVAGTVDLTANAPNTDDIRITGALAITGFTVASDRVLRVTAGGAFTLTNGAGLVTQTGANIVAAAGDTFMLRATSANVVEVLEYVSAVNAPQLFPITASVAGSALTVNIANANLDFRNGTLTTGTATRIASGALSITVPSGATLGSVSGQPMRVGVAVAYNAGTPVLCVVNGTIDESALYSPTTISSGSATIGTVYSASSVAANSPMRLIGYVDVPNVTAGTYASITQVQSYGGQVGAASLGVGQTWQNVTASRAYLTTYYNTTGRPITVSVAGTYSAGSGNAKITVNGVDIIGSGTAASFGVNVLAIVPPGGSYVASATGSLALTLFQWSELR